MNRSETAERILTCAERNARRGGYNSFSFREIAAEIGIKSASVHYHFPTKEALAEAMVDRYGDRFLAALGPADDGAPRAALDRYVAAYAEALKSEGLMCLCGLFGAEIAELPPPVAAGTRRFFAANLAWLDRVFARAGQPADQARRSGAQMIAALEGAMILARAMQDPALFDQATGDLAAGLL